MKFEVRLAHGVVLLSAAVAGCSSPQGMSLPWIPPAPGISAEEARARAQGGAAARPAAAANTPAPAAPGAAAASPAPAVAAPAPPATGWGSAPSATPVAAAPAVAAPSPAPAAAQPAAAQPAAAPAAATDAARLGSGYTQATRYGDMLFVSGQIAMDLRSRAVASEAGIDEQARMALDNLRAVLEANGLTMANVVSTTVYLKNINDLVNVDNAYSRAFRGTLPSRTVVEVSRLPRGVLVEISAVAGR